MQQTTAGDVIAVLAIVGILVVAILILVAS
jgi:hypothetical protein